MNIQNIDNLSKSLEKYRERKDELDLEPATVDIFQDKALNFHAQRIHNLLNAIMVLPTPKPERVEPKKKSKKKS